MCLGRWDAESFHHEACHASFDLIEKPGLRRVERVVEVEDPAAYMGEISGNHATRIPRCGNRHNLKLLI
jgi:hypothetical protein